MRRIAYILILLNCFNFLSGQKVEKKMTAADSVYYPVLPEVLKKYIKVDSILKEAENNFKDGMYLKCIENLNGIWKLGKLYKKEKEKVLELLAKAYLEVDRPEEADRTVNNLLHNNPHYELREGENSEDYNSLVKKYKVHPLFTIGVRNTADWVNYKTMKIYSVLDGLDYNKPYSKYRYGILEGFGFMYYGWGELEFDRDISFNAEFTFWWTKYNRDFTSPPGFSLSFWETDNYLEIPVYVKRYFHLGKNVLPYITAGIGWNYMTQSLGSLTISYTKDDIITGKNIDFSAYKYDINMLESRNRHTFEWIAGAGIGYKIKNLRLFFDARYYGGLNSFTNPEKGLTNSLLVDEFYYVDSSVHLNQFELGVSISYTLFNSIKKSKQ
jgi:opacity protein-like surface antigen